MKANDARAAARYVVLLFLSLYVLTLKGISRGRGGAPGAKTHVSCASWADLIAVLGGGVVSVLPMHDWARRWKRCAPHRVLLAAGCLAVAASATPEHITVRPSRLHHALIPPSRPVVVAVGEIEAVDPSWSDCSLTFRVESVVLGNAGSAERLRVWTDILEWPSVLVPHEAGTYCVLILRERVFERKDRPPVGWVARAVVPARRGESLPHVATRSEAVRVLEDQLLATLEAESRAPRQAAILDQVAPILSGQNVHRVEPFIESSHAWVRRAALAGLVYAGEEDALLDLVARDIQEYFVSDSQDACRNAPDSTPFCTPRRRLLQTYFFLEPRSWRWGSRWTDEEADKHRRLWRKLQATGSLSDTVATVLLGGYPAPRYLAAWQRAPACLRRAIPAVIGVGPGEVTSLFDGMKEGAGMILHGALVVGLVAVVGTVGGASEGAPGEAIAGLQAALHVAREATHGEPIPVSMELCNVGEQALLLDYYAGDWHVLVRGRDGKVIPHGISTESLRPIRKPTPLPPGECRRTDLPELRLVSGLPGSSADWFYDPLAAGVYTFVARYRSGGRRGYELLRERDPDVTIPWTGTLTSAEVSVTVR